MSVLQRHAYVGMTEQAGDDGHGDAVHHRVDGVGMSEIAKTDVLDVGLAAVGAAVEAANRAPAAAPEGGVVHGLLEHAERLQVFGGTRRALRPGWDGGRRHRPRSAAREYRIGWRLDTAVSGGPGFEVNLDATRREAANGDTPPEHGVMLRSAIRW